MARPSCTPARRPGPPPKGQSAWLGAQNSSVLMQNSSFFIQNSSCWILNSSFLLTALPAEFVAEHLSKLMNFVFQMMNFVFRMIKKALYSTWSITACLSWSFPYSAERRSGRPESVHWISPLIEEEVGRSDCCKLMLKWPLWSTVFYWKSGNFNRNSQ